MSVVDDFAIADRDFPKDAIDGDPPPVDVDLPAFAEVPGPNQPGSIHSPAEVDPASFPEQEVLTPDLLNDRINDARLRTA